MFSFTYPNPLILIREDIEAWTRAVILQQVEERESHHLDAVGSPETILDSIAEICRADSSHPKCLHLFMDHDTTWKDIWKPISDFLSLHQELQMAVILTFPKECRIPYIQGSIT